MQPGPAQLFLEDFAEGQRFEGPSRTIRDEDVFSFSALTGDRHPIHYDAEYAKATRFGRPVVHGLHLTSLTALGSTPLTEQLGASMIAFVEQGARFLKPVFVNDTLRAEFEIADGEPKPGRDWGRLKLAVKLVNQHGETVLEGHHVYMLRSRSGPADAPGSKS